MTDVFVSYARADKERVAVMAKALEARGFDVWWDHELAAGDRYAERIQETLNAAKAVLVVWSPASLQSDFVKDEAGVGRDRGVLVPVMLDVSEPPIGFGQYNAINLTGYPNEPDSKAKFEMVVAALEKLKGEASPILRARSAAPPPAAAKAPSWKTWAFGLAGVAILAAGGYGVSKLRPTPGGDGQPEQPAPQTTGLGPSERYGLKDSEIASLTPQALAERGLSNADMELLEAAVAENDPLSLTLLCLDKLYGVRSTADDAAALTACQRAKDKGAPLGGYMLSVMAREGRGGAPDAARADALLKEAADAGDSRAQFERAGQLAASDATGARRLAETCAARGNVDCRFLVASMQAKGQGGAKDPAAAVATYELLVEPPYFHAAATRELALLHLRGETGAPPNVERGVDLLKRAELLSDGQASYELGKLAESGRGLDRDPGAALEYYRTAVNNGYAPARVDVARLERR